MVEDVNDMRVIKRPFDAPRTPTRTSSRIGAKAVWRSFNRERRDAPPKPRGPGDSDSATNCSRSARRCASAFRACSTSIRTPPSSRVLREPGRPPQNLVYSDYTTEQLYKEGAKRGAIDPCFPSKIGIPHVHNLIYQSSQEEAARPHLLPDDRRPASFVGQHAVESRLPDGDDHARSGEGGVHQRRRPFFAQNGIEYLDPLLNLDQPRFLAKQMFEAFKDILGLTREENDRRDRGRYKALDIFYNVIQRGAREVLESARSRRPPRRRAARAALSQRPGLNHEILEEFQKLGYPVFTHGSLPIDDDISGGCSATSRAAIIKTPLDVQDVVEELLLREHQPQDLGRQVRARHPNLVALELSTSSAGTTRRSTRWSKRSSRTRARRTSAFKDIDENKPRGSIKIQKKKKKKKNNKIKKGNKKRRDDHTKKNQTEEGNRNEGGYEGREGKTGTWTPRYRG